MTGTTNVQTTSTSVGGSVIKSVQRGRVSSHYKGAWEDEEVESRDIPITPVVANKCTVYISLTEGYNVPYVEANSDGMIDCIHFPYTRKVVRDSDNYYEWYWDKFSWEIVEFN